MITTPWYWIDVAFLPWGELRITAYSRRNVSPLMGPDIALELRLCPDKVVIESEEFLYWQSPRNPQIWVWEIQDWLRALKRCCRE